MSSIYILPESVFPQNFASGINAGQKPSILSIGDILEARVAEILSENRVLITMQNQQMIASSSIPLSLGQKLRVQVARTQPEILLRLIGSEASESQRMNQGLRAFLSDPDKLLRLFDQAGKMLSAQGDSALSEGVRSCLQEMSRLLNSLILSDETVRDPLFLKKFVSTLGLDLENRLLKHSMQQPVAGSEMWRGNLKGLLAKIAEQLQPGNSEQPASDAAIRLSAFAKDGLQSLETHQLVNTLLQSRDDVLMFQLPLLLSSGLSMADVFFHQERSKDAERSTESCTVAMFLNMDALGDLMIEARFRDAQVGCSIRCLNPEVRAYIAGNLEQLNEALKTLGLKVDQLVCVCEPDISRRRTEHLARLSAFESDAVNLFV